MKKNKTQTQPLSANTKKWLIVTAIILVAAIALGITLYEILKPVTKNPADNPNPDNPSSNLTIRNGDFRYAVSENTSFPHAAQNWTKYGYKAPEGSNHDFNEITSTVDALMGIIDTDTENWEKVSTDLSAEDVTVVNPGVHSEELLDKNVYMIAAKNPTAASILSDSFSVPSGASVKITVWLNTSQLKDGSKAVIMLQKNNTNAKEDNWYAYDFEIEKTDGWQSYDFYIFNRETSSRSVKCSVGLGNVYGVNSTADDETTNSVVNGEGVLFVDDITFETVTANDYRVYADAQNVNHTAYIIENSDSESEVEFKEWLNLNGSALGSVDKSEDYLALLGAGNDYSPFTNKYDFEKGMKIYSVTHDGETTAPVGVRLANSLKVVIDPEQKDHHHFSFWVRVAEENKLATANVLLQKSVGSNKYETIDNGSFTLQESVQEISTDVNCGWKKYDIYLKPSSVETEITITVTLGKDAGYTADESKPQGTMYVTSPVYELISSKDYSNASSGTLAKKVSMVGATGSLGITNGSFSNTTTTLPDQPSSWTPVFAGSNMIYKDGQGDEEIAGIDRSATSVAGSGVVKGSSTAPSHDDTEKNVLKLVNNTATSHGYLSSNISLSAKSVYAISVLAKTEGTAKPYIYVINNAKENRAAAVIAKIENGSVNAIDDVKVFGYPESSSEGEGWQRYYFVIVTGENSVSVNLALFNGSIDGANKQLGTVYYDQADMKQIGSYSLDKPEDDEDAKVYDVNYKGQDDAYTAYDKLEWADKDGKAFDNVARTEPTEEEWAKMRAIPEETDDNNNNGGDDNNTTKQPVNLAVLFTSIASILLVAALAIVIVITIFKRKKNK